MLRERVINRFRTHKTGALLAYLAYHRDAALSRDRLVDAIWPEDDVDQARQKLRLALHSLHNQLEPPEIPRGSVLVADRASVKLNPPAYSTDVAEFEAALRAATSAASDVTRVQQLMQAAELYRGPLLSDYFEEWIEPERERLADAHFHALGQLTHYWERFLSDRRLSSAL